jgi:hypothetical protein
MWTSQLDTGGSEPFGQPRRQQRIRPGAKAFATLVIPVGNRHQINPHG